MIRILVLISVMVLFFGSPVWAHTISLEVEKIKRILGADLEHEDKEIKLFVEVDFGSCDDGPSQATVRLPADLQKVFTFETKKKIREVVDECFKKLPPGDPWPFVDVQITAVEVDLPSFDQDAFLRQPTDTDIGDYAEYQERFTDIP